MEIGTLSEADEAGDLFSVGKEIKRREGGGPVLGWYDSSEEYFVISPFTCVLCPFLLPRC